MLGFYKAENEYNPLMLDFYKAENEHNPLMLGFYKAENEHNQSKNKKIADFIKKENFVEFKNFKKSNF